jgi:hypothetical protein
MLPTTRLGGYDVSRLIIGGNPFSGGSHVSAEMDRAFVGYYTNERIVAALLECESQGLNTMQSRGDRHILRALHEYRAAGGSMQWIAQTASELADLHGNIRQVADAGAIAVYHHGSRTDALWHEGRIDEVLPLLDTMRESGVLAGLGTHLPEVVEYAEEREWAVDFYLTCFYALSRRRHESPVVSGHQEAEVYDDADRETMCRVIRATPRPCFAFKILAASRKCSSPDEVREAFRYAFDNIKPTDAVIVGMYQGEENQVAMNAAIVAELLGPGCGRRQRAGAGLVGKS